MSKLCGHCGKRGMAYTNVKGRTGFSWKGYTDIEITVDLELLVCSNCDNIGLMSSDAKKLDEALEKSIGRAL